MGSGLGRHEAARRHTEAAAATSELYVDKVVKFLPGLLQLMLAIGIIGLAHAKNLDCEGHKIYSFLVLCQALSLLLILLLWYWCYGHEVANHVQELIHHANHLTNQYKRYNDGLYRSGVHREVTEATLHADLDNYLEYLLHVLTVKGERLYVRHLLKWIMVLSVSFLWLVGFVIVLLQCGLPDPLYMKVLWLMPALILAGSIALVTFHVVYDLCKTRGYEATFFYQAIPGAMDARLGRIISSTYNPRYVWLLSRHCGQNAQLCSNPGLSKSLARKFCYISHQHRKDRWRDQHFPTLRSNQVERFQFNSAQFEQVWGRGDAGCCDALLWCGLLSPDPDDKPPIDGVKGTTTHRVQRRRQWKEPGKAKVGVVENEHGHADGGDASSGYSSGFKAPLQTPVALEDGYMTPHLFARKLAKESPTPEQLLDEEMVRQQKKSPRDAAVRAKPSARDDVHVASLGAQRYPPSKAERNLGLSRDDTELDYGAFYHPHHSDPHRMQREYDPLTYGVRMAVKKEMAKDVKTWRF